MPSCAGCGAMVSPEAVFCGRCGARQAAEVGCVAAPEASPPLSPGPPSPPATRWALVSFALGIVAVVACPLAGPFAIWMGVLSSRTEQEQAMAQAGVVLGVVGSLIFAGALVTAVVLGAEALLSAPLRNP